MKVAFFSTQNFEKPFFKGLDQHHQITYYPTSLTPQTVSLAQGHQVVCAFVEDDLQDTLKALAEYKIQLIALRSAGFNHVDIPLANSLNLPVVHVPEYSPYAVAEHAVGLLLALNRKIYQAYQRVRDFNFSLEGLMGIDLHGKTVGVLGTGRIGSAFARIMHGFGSKLLLYDLKPDSQLAQLPQARYCELEQLLTESDVLSLHLPLTPETHHIIDHKALSLIKQQAYLINTSRGGLIETSALIQALKQDHLAGVGLDVYEEEEHVFFHDFSQKTLQDDQLARLISFPRTLITSHQGFFTHEAVTHIAKTTQENITHFEQKKGSVFYAPGSTCHKESTK